MPAPPVRCHVSKVFFCEDIHATAKLYTVVWSQSRTFNTLQRRTTSNVMNTKMCLQSYGSGRQNSGKWDEWKTEAMAHQWNRNTLDNGMDELTSAFLIHCHPRQHRVFFIKQSVVYSVSLIGATHVAFWVARGLNLHRILRCDTA